MGTRHGVHSDGKWFRVSAGGGGLGEKMLSHRGAITLEAVHAVDALEKAFARYVLPDIGDTGQGSQFTAGAFTGPCWTGHRATDGRQGSWRDNVFVERVGRSITYEEV